MYKRILVPVDPDHPNSWSNVLPHIKALASVGKTLIYAVSVVPHLGTVISQAASASPFAPEDKSKWFDDALTLTRAQLADVIGGATPAIEGVELQVRSGTVYSEILDAASELNADLIVIASHRPELKDYLLGPNAAKVVRHAACSVFVVRS